MKKLFLSMMAICCLCLLLSCSKSDDDESLNAYSNFYWKASELYGKWIQENDPDYWIEFYEPNNFRCDVGRGKDYKRGYFFANEDMGGHCIYVQFPDSPSYDANMMVFYSFEWLSADKKRMSIAGYTYTKQ